LCWVYGQRRSMNKKTAWQTARRKSLQEAGLCVRCGTNPPRLGKQTCGCAIEYDRRRKAALVASGRCADCRGPLDSPGKLCTACREKYQEKGKTRREAHQVDPTLCPRCGAPKCEGEGPRWCDRCKLRLRKREQTLKVEVLTAYGGRCECCREDRIGFLTIDHVMGGGKKHRIDLHGKLYRWLKRQKYPDGYRVLCFNCNCGRAVNGGVCPHAAA